jgi:predicted HTH domain antitoxin
MRWKAIMDSDALIKLTKAGLLSLPLRLPKNLLKVAELRARQQRIDRAAAIRQLLYAAATDYVLELLSEGRISLSKAAELLDCSALEIHRLAQERGLPIGSDAEDYKQAQASLAQLKKSNGKAGAAPRTKASSATQTSLTGIGWPFLRSFTSISANLSATGRAAAARALPRPSGAPPARRRGGPYRANIRPISPRPPRARNLG